MNILYIASGIPVPGTLGGSSHTLEVAQGLAQLGHHVHLVAAGQKQWSRFAPLVRLTMHPLPPIHLYHQHVPKLIALAGVWPVFRLAQILQPDVIMERYYNMAGSGIWTARRLARPSLLEVNALIIDPPGTPKQILDMLLGHPFERWAITQCQWATHIVTPLHTTVPSAIPRTKITELPWGANPHRFTISRVPSPIPTAVFLGSFRAWHGILDFVRAAILLLQRGYDYHFLLIGDGPQRHTAQALARQWPHHIRFTGAVPYETVPHYLAHATVGVAPFSTTPHRALQAAGFFWSPLKVFEYMAAGLPVITTDLHPLNRIVRHMQEGLLFAENDIHHLAAHVATLLNNPIHARRLGEQARARLTSAYTWQHHCEQLDGILRQILGHG